MTWTPERTAVLSDMWLWGHSSNTIAKIIGETSRNAVMGKINRMGLMGKGGIRLGRYEPDTRLTKEEIEEVVAGFNNAPYDRTDFQHLLLATMLAMLFHGCNAKRNAAILEETVDTIIAAQQQIDTTGAWKDGEPPPPHWWHPVEGPTAMVLDSLVAEGIVVFKMTDGERAYMTVDKAA